MNPSSTKSLMHATSAGARPLPRGGKSFRQKTGIQNGFDQRGRLEAVAHVRSLVSGYAGVSPTAHPKIFLPAVEKAIAAGSLVKRLEADPSWKLPRLSTAARFWFSRNPHVATLEAIRSESNAVQHNVFQDLLFSDVGVARWATDGEPLLDQIVPFVGRLLTHVFHPEQFKNVWDYVHTVEAGLPKLQRRALIGLPVGYGAVISEGFFRGIINVDFSFYEALVVGLRQSSHEALQHYFTDIETFHLAPRDPNAWKTRGKRDWDKVGRALGQAKKAAEEAGLPVMEASLRKVPLLYCDAHLPAHLFRAIEREGKIWGELLKQNPKAYAPPQPAAPATPIVAAPISEARRQDVAHGFLQRVPGLAILREGNPKNAGLRARVDAVASSLTPGDLKPALQWWRKEGSDLTVPFEHDLHYLEYQLLDFALRADLVWGRYFGGLAPYHHAYIRRTFWSDAGTPRFEFTRRAINEALSGEVTRRVGKAVRDPAAFVTELQKLLRESSLEKLADLNLAYGRKLGRHVFLRNANLAWQDLVFDALNHHPNPAVAALAKDLPTESISASRRVGQGWNVTAGKRERFLAWYDRTYRKDFGRQGLRKYVAAMNAALGTDLLRRVRKSRGHSQNQGAAAVIVTALREHPEAQIAAYYRHLRLFHVTGAKVPWKDLHYPNWEILDAVTWEALQLLSAREGGLDLKSFEDPDFRQADDPLIAALEALIPRVGEALLSTAPLRYGGRFPATLYSRQLYHFGISAGNLVAHALEEGKGVPATIREHFLRRGLNDLPVMQHYRAARAVEMISSS